MTRRRRIAAYAGAGVLLVVVLLAAAVLVITNTDWGRERVRLFALDRLAAATDGTVEIRRIEGNLLRRIYLLDVRIVDEQGRPFLQADTIRSRFSLRGLLRQRIALTNVRMVQGVVILDEPPGEDWNYVRIFRIEPEERVPDTAVGWGDWVSLHNVQLVNTRIMIRSAWAPPEDITPEERARAIERALSGEMRDNIVAVEGGYQNVMDFRQLHATMPVIVPAHPDSAGIPIEISHFTGIAQPFRPPVAQVEALAGRFRLERDTLHFTDVRADLPDSRLAVAGLYALSSGDLLLRMNGAPMAFDDMRWLYPRMPEEGGGDVRVTVSARSLATRIIAEDMDMAVGEATLEGRIDVTLGDTLRLGDTDVRFTRLGSGLLARVLPALAFPRDGVFTGRAAVTGPPHALAIDGDVTFHDDAGPSSRVIAEGELGVQPQLRFGAMHLEFRPLHAHLIRAFAPEYPLRGAITGVASLTGTTDLLQLRSDLFIDEPGVGRSRILAAGRMDQRQDLRLDDVVVRMDPLRADLLRDAVPELPRGALIAGTVRLDGAPQRSLQVDGAIALDDPASGTSNIAARGGIEFGDELRLSDMVVRVDPLRVDLIRGYQPELPAGATMVGSVRLAGVPSRELQVDGDVVLSDPASGVSEFGATGLVSFGRELRFDGLGLRLHSVQLDLLRPWAPDLPPGGTVAGALTLTGAPARSLAVDGGITHVDPRLGTSRFALAGGLEFGDGLAFRNLDVRMDPLQLALVRGFLPDLPIGGVVAGRAVLDGTPQRFTARGNVVHDEAGRRSHVAGSMELATGPGGWAVADLQLQPLDLGTVGRFVPAAGLHGSVMGSFRARGRMDDLRLDADLRVAGGGSIALDGWINATGSEPAYDLRARTDAFDIAAVTSRAPAVTSLTGRIAAEGRGTDPATMSASISADLVDLSVDDVAADRLLVDARIDGGLAHFDTGFVRLGTAEAQVNGAFGLAAGRHGELAFSVRADSLHAFAGAMPGTREGVPPAPTRTLLAADTLVVDTAAFARPQQPLEEPVRPAVTPRYAGGSRETGTLTVADISAAVREPERLARDTATGALPQGRDVPLPAVALQDSIDLPRTDTVITLDVPADSLAGSLFAEGVLRGNIHQFDADGHAEVDGLVFRGAQVAAGAVDFVARDVRTPVADVEVDGRFEGVRAAGVAFDSVSVEGGYRGDRHGQGRAVLAAYQDDDTDVHADVAFTLALERNELRVADATIRFDTTTWQAAQPGVIAWGGGDLEVESLEFVSNDGGRIFVDGVLPAAGSGNFDLQLRNFQLEQVATLLQLEDDLEGAIDLDARVTGTRSAPVINGTGELRDGRRNGGELPDVRAVLAYADETLTADALLLHEGRTLATLDARLPMDLAVTTTGPRLLDGPLQVDISADSIPAEMLPAFTGVVEDTRGRISGDIAIRGTFSRPLMEGVANLDLGRARVVPLGVTFDDIAATLTLDGSTISVDSIVAWGGGPARVTGTIDVADLSDPVFDLVLDADNSRVISTADVELRVDADVTVTGALSGLLVQGDIHARSGTIRVPELAELGRTNVVNLDDPGTFDRDGGALDDFQPLEPRQPEVLRNATVDVGIVIDRDVWVRSTEANVEIYTPPDIGALRVQANGTDGIVLRGSINTDRGDYEFMGRRFRMTRGAMAFMGESPINPILQIAAEHEVRLPGREALQIRIVIGGTIDDLEITLESGAQPPISQSDLLSFLAFGRDASSLLQQQGSGLSGQGGAAGELVGNIAGLATQQLTSVALEAAVSEVEREVARELSLDMFRISSADVPAEVFTGGYGDIFRATEVEAGRYLRPRLFLAAQARGGRPGLRLEYRTPRGYEWHAAWQPRFMPVDPTLMDVAPGRTTVFGTFLFREWRF
ncbi:MAG TPA: translocation/assembly module TamB domain-containing protein [Longimicrobiales bacterium]|nr:translocation/assembly module TamB domain-containing protein [Longimicrobiales bacterium]